jgi:hypothetical protein
VRSLVERERRALHRGKVAQQLCTRLHAEHDACDPWHELRKRCKDPCDGHAAAWRQGHQDAAEPRRSTREHRSSPCRHRQKTLQQSAPSVDDHILPCADCIG